MDKAFPVDFPAERGQDGLRGRWAATGRAVPANNQRGTASLDALKVRPTMRHSISHSISQVLSALTSSYC